MPFGFTGWWLRFGLFEVRFSGKARQGNGSGNGKDDDVVVVPL
jgi:hypothetical protein